MPSKNILEELYLNKLYSQRRIAQELGLSKHTVSKLMSLYSIPIRSKIEESYIQHGKSFSAPARSSNKKALLYGLGIGLYWGEGNKVDKYSARLGNTDPGVINTFILFLQEVCGIKRKDIRFGLQIFNDIKPQEAKEYWIKVTGFTEDAFHPTISVIPPQGKGTYRRKNKNGVLQIYVSNKKLKDWLNEEISYFAEVAQG